MGRIHIGQTRLRISLTCNSDLTEATQVAIKYKKPNGTQGSWAATVSNATTGIIYYDVANESDLDMEGAWTIWAHITYADGDVAAGDPVKMAVYTEGKNKPPHLVWN